MIKALLWGAGAALLTVSAAVAAAPAPPAWVVQPGAETCRTELELVGLSGNTVSAALISDGAQVELTFARADAPERAFLPIRVDHKPFANLVLRQADGRTAIQLSADSLAALRKGATLQIGWLADEPVQMGLKGSEQGLADLRTCGAQVAARFRAQQAARQDARARDEAEARAEALADEQMAAAKAQKAAAEAAAERDAAEAERLHAAADAARQRAQAEAERARQQAEADSYPYARVRVYREDPRYRDDPPEPYDRYERYDPPARYSRW
ncbi:hypothetical protein LJR219_000733 [Phenylobacterium sp. LjRoot219]|uniref:hypothetical protein n=1 Tax=Phenylobacterium sp. LjRoot219 TaxID=3342283 RepID=UPI003ECFD203